MSNLDRRPTRRRRTSTQQRCALAVLLAAVTVDGKGIFQTAVQFPQLVFSSVGVSTPQLRSSTGRTKFASGRPRRDCNHLSSNSRPLGSKTVAAPRVTALGPNAQTAGVAFGVLALLKVVWDRIDNWLKTPKRPYANGSVGASYDQWTRDGVVEHYWGEHIHMGSYFPMNEQSGYSKRDGFIFGLLRATFGRLKNFKQAKIDFVHEMIDFSRATAPQKILDVGCGIGGSSRILAQRFPNAQVLGITLSPEQAARATELAKVAGLTNCRFEVMDALAMTYEDNTYDMVWACESGEHMPDKKRYIEEMVRVLKPQGNLVVATWCERDPVPPFTNEERRTLDFMYAEWSHPYFISLNKYKDHLLGTNALDQVETADWTEQTLPSWRHSIWVGVWSPLYWINISLRRPLSFLGFIREVYTLEVYHRSMVSGLMVYGMMRAIKK